MELNESALIEKELTIRCLRLNKEVLETRRSAIRWLALSLGIINPGESRLGSVAVLDAMIQFQFVLQKDPSVKEMIEYINTNWEEINEKTLRYHLLRMKRMGFVENEKGKFYLKPPSFGDRFDAQVWISAMLESFYRDVSGRVGEVVRELKTKSGMR